MKRLFIAIHLHEEARHKTAALLHRLPYDRSLKFVPEESLHLTLVFIGGAPEEAMPAIKAAIEEAALPIRPFTLTFTKLGAFPDWQRPRVLWFGIEEPSGQLESLVERLRGALAKRKVHLTDHKPFTPHLTLARVKGPLGEGILSELARVAAEHYEIPRVEVSSIELMESILSSAGPPRYLELYRHLLG